MLQSSGHLATERPYTLSYFVGFIWLIVIKIVFDRTGTALS